MRRCLPRWPGDFAARAAGPVALAALCALTAYAGAAGPSSGHCIDPSEIPEEKILFVAGGGIGNAAGVGAPTERELTLGRSTAAPEQTADLAWPKGSPVAFAATCGLASHRHVRRGRRGTVRLRRAPSAGASEFARDALDAVDMPHTLRLRPGDRTCSAEGQP
jgi:hypothetical protein